MAYRKKYHPNGGEGRGNIRVQLFSHRKQRLTSLMPNPTTENLQTSSIQFTSS
jgi:hypothetical protein